VLNLSAADIFNALWKVGITMFGAIRIKLILLKGKEQRRKDEKKTARKKKKFL
jgi:hypothetical protein